MDSSKAVDPRDSLPITFFVLCCIALFHWLALFCVLAHDLVYCRFHIAIQCNFVHALLSYLRSLDTQHELRMFGQELLVLFCRRASVQPVRRRMCFHEVPR